MKRRKEMRLAKIIYVVAQNVRVSFFTSKFVSPVVNLAHNWPASDVPLQATVYLLPTSIFRYTVSTVCVGRVKKSDDYFLERGVFFLFLETHGVDHKSISEIAMKMFIKVLELGCDVSFFVV